MAARDHPVRAGFHAALRRGHELAPTAGYRRPSTDAVAGGHALWLARQLADTVTVPGRTSIRMQFPRDVTHRNTP